MSEAEEDEKVPFPLNRVDGTHALRALRPENVKVRGDEAMIELVLSADHDIELYFPASDGTFELQWLSLAGEVLIHLTAMDNEVQLASAEQWPGSPCPSSHYEDDLAYITLTNKDEVILHYFVIGCNAEWDERFVRSDGDWERVESA